MDFSEISEKAPPVSKPYSWKGHSQPPPNERLQQARYFLADEDPDRCLDFASRITEIEEYVADLESEIKSGSIECDDDLLKDVKVKLAVHRDWERRRAEGIPDIGCDKKPWQLPFSTRTFSTQAPPRPNTMPTATGLPVQVREDHPPFSIDRENDHSAFIAALKRDASGDPDEVDTSTNLLWTESRAYTLAQQEPNLIPSWMHPTHGVPKKGISASDPNTWHQQSSTVYLGQAEQNRPKREWIPRYLLTREQRINSLLKTDLGRQEMNELEELLHFVEPLHLHRLHAENMALDEDDALGLLNPVEQVHRQNVSDAFAAEQQAWLSTFTEVYFIPRAKSGERVQSDQPGVFYVDPGFLDSEREATVKNANDILTHILASRHGFRFLTGEDFIAIENLSQLSQPGEVTNLGRQRAAILRRAGVKSQDDLESADAQIYEEIHRAEHGKREIWLQSLANNKPEFRFLRPGEIPEVPEQPNLAKILYIPWEMASVPTTETPFLHESAISSTISFMPSYKSKFPLNTRTFQVGPKDSQVDFTGKAERRGIQRAAIEICLNLLATNQEQHRPADRFRVLDQTRVHVSLEKEIPISMELEPFRRQEERHTFEFTKKMLAYKDWKEYNYELARDKLIEDSSLIIQPEDERFRTSYGEKIYPEDPQDESKSWILLDPPINYHGPFSIADTLDAIEVARRRQADLSRIALRLQNAYTESPRPLLERLLSLVAQGMDPSKSTRHPLYDDLPLSKQDLVLLEDITEDSWEEMSWPYSDVNILQRESPGIDVSRLEEFEVELKQIDDIPFWKPMPGEVAPIHDETNADLTQLPYDPSVQSQVGASLDHLRLEFQMRKGHIRYTNQQMRQFLSVMARYGRIHYDGVRGNERVSRIPPSGHPENKYVTSRDEAAMLPYIRINDRGQPEVQYDAQGTMGPIIVQPNKYEHLQSLAFRLGRDMLRVLKTLQDPPIDAEQALTDQIITAQLAEEHMKHITSEERSQTGTHSSVDLSKINLVNIAQEICSAAPHLVTKLGIELPYRNPYISTPPAFIDINETEAAALIQLKILEEIHNNFEPKFPVNETVWDFASDRLATETVKRNGRIILVKKPLKKFFSVRRHPICCQSKETKETIRNSGPKIQEEPPMLTEEQRRKQYEAEKARAAKEAAKGPVKMARHIRGQRPYYPFGETPYQEAYQSHIMEYELKDVEEFNPKPTGLKNYLRAGIKNTLTQVWGTKEPDLEAVVEPAEDPPNPNDPHPLPRIPAGWRPDNISAEEKRFRLIELAKQTPGFPDPNIKEYYHTQEEIEAMNAREEDQRMEEEIAANDAEVARVFGKSKEQATWQEWAEWQRMLNINPRTGLLIAPVNVEGRGTGAGMTMTGALSVVPGQRSDPQRVRGMRLGQQYETGGQRSRSRTTTTGVGGNSKENTTTSGKVSSAGQATSTSRRRSSRSPSIPISDFGGELTVEEAAQYIRDLEENDEFSLDEYHDDFPNAEDDQLPDAPPAPPAGSGFVPHGGGISAVGGTRQGDIDIQVILESEANAQMLREVTLQAFRREREGAAQMQEVAERAGKDAEKLRDEERRGRQWERREELPRVEDLPAIGGDDDDEEGDDEEEEEDEDEIMNSDGDDLFDE